MVLMLTKTNIIKLVILVNTYLISTIFSQETVNKDSTLQEDRKAKVQKIINKAEKEKQALDLINELVYLNENNNEYTFILDYLLLKNWKKSFKLAIESLFNARNPVIAEYVDKFNNSTLSDISLLKNKLALKKKDIIRISPVFEWSQDDDTIKMKVRFAKNLETPGDIDVSNFKVNCTRSQLEVQAYKEHDDYVVHYYRRLNLYEFIKPYSCKSYKETASSYIIHFSKNQATLFWNFLNQPSEDHYNTYTWLSVHEKYDDKVQYTDFREHAMENLLISDIEEYLKDNAPAKKKRMKQISRAKKYLVNKNYEDKNYCLSPAQFKHCNIPKITDWGYWLL